MVDVRWEAEDATYRGEMKEVKADKKGVTRYHVYYPCDKTLVAHDFDTDECCITNLVEPPISQIEQMLRSQAGNYFGIMANPLHGKTYKLTKKDVEAHFSTDPEKAFLSSLTLQFKHVPESGKKKSATSRVKQDCVPGGLSKAFAYAGDVETTTTITAMEDTIIKAEGTNGDRMTAATHGVVRKLCPYEVRKLKGVKCALQIDPAYVTVVTLKPGNHSVSLYAGLIFDSAERKPLPLTVENLTHCLGAEYEGIKRGYYFVKQVSQKRPLGAHGSPNASPVVKKARKA